MTRHADLIESDRVLNDAHWFLAGFDRDRREFVFVESDRALLSGAAFIDGRTALTRTGRAARVGLDTAAAYSGLAGADTVDRFIFHVAFCGSTLLARALDWPGRCLAYKEPQVLIDIAAKTTAEDARAASGRSRAVLVDAAMRHLRKTFSLGERSVVKPSNWPLDIVEDLCGAERDVRAVFLTADPEDYCVSVLRGGADRAGYVLKFLINLRCRDRRVGDAVAAIEGAAMTPMARVLRFAMLALRVQEATYARSLARLGPGRAVALTYGTLRTDPVSAVSAAANILNIDYAAGEIERSVHDAFAADAKETARPFETARRRAADAEIAANHRRDIAEAVSWAEAAFGPPGLGAASDFARKSA